jgi:hypothetical protein
VRQLASSLGRVRLFEPSQSELFLPRDARSTSINDAAS